MKIKKIALLILVPAVLAATIAVSATAMAARSESPAVDRFGTVLTGLVERGVISQEQADVVLEEATPFLDELSQRQPGQRPAIRQTNVIDAVAEVLGLEQDAIAAQLREGTSLVDVIETNGGSVAAVIDHIAGQLAAGLDDAVAQGDIDQEQADKILAGVVDRAEQVINNFYRPKQQRPDIKPQNVVGITAAVLGIEAEAVLAQLQEGLTLVEVIEAGGSSTGEVAAFYVAEVTAQLEQALVDGQITQEQIDRSLSKASERIEQLIANFKPRSADLEGPGLKAENVIGAIVEVLGSDAEAIIAQVGEGATLAEIIEAGGSSVAAVVDFAVQQMAVQLDEAVAEGKIDQDQADAMLSQAAERIENAITSFGEGDGRPNVRGVRTRPVDSESNGADRPGRGRGNQPAPNGNNLMTIVLEMIGADRDDAKTAKREGLSLGELATSFGFDVDALTDQIVDEQASRFTENGRGNFNADRADHFLQKTRDNVERLLNRTQGRGGDAE